MSFDKDYLKGLIDDLRMDIGRNITIKTPTRNACSLCLPSGYYNPQSDASYWTKCPVCAGAYWLNTMVSTEVLARVHWTSDEAAAVTPGGKYYVGDARAHVDPSYHTLMQQAQDGGTVVIDGQEMTIVKINPKGVPEINRIEIILLGVGTKRQG